MEKFKVTIDKVGFAVSGILGVLLSVFMLFGACAAFVKSSAIDSKVVVAGVVGLLMLLCSIWILTDLNGFEVNVDGEDVHVKDGKKSYDFKVQDIKKVVLVERSGQKSTKVLWCDITAGKNVLKVNHQHIGFLNMLQYLKKNYDSGVMAADTISSSGYAKLNDFMKRCPEGRKRERLEAKRDS